MSLNQPIRTIHVTAREESFRVVQVAGNLFVCTRENGSCCCGWEEKGRMPFDNALWAEEWERRGIRSRLHLTFTGCLGPCVTGNNALLQVHGQSIWLKDLNSADVVSAVFDYIEEMLSAGSVVSAPLAIAPHVMARFLPSDELGMEVAGSGEGLERLDPVCLMDVDPATARHTVEHNGQVFAFCAPSCRKQFVADPESFLAPLGL